MSWSGSYGEHWRRFLRFPQTLLLKIAGFCGIWLCFFCCWFFFQIFFHAIEDVWWWPHAGVCVINIFWVSSVAYISRKTKGFKTDKSAGLWTGLWRVVPTDVWAEPQMNLPAPQCIYIFGVASGSPILAWHQSFLPHGPSQPQLETLTKWSRAVLCTELTCLSCSPSISNSSFRIVQDVEMYKKKLSAKFNNATIWTALSTTCSLGSTTTMQRVLAFVQNEYKWKLSLSSSRCNAWSINETGTFLYTWIGKQPFRKENNVIDNHRYREQQKTDANSHHHCCQLKKECPLLIPGHKGLAWKLVDLNNKKAILSSCAQELDIHGTNVRVSQIKFPANAWDTGFFLLSASKSSRTRLEDALPPCCGIALPRRPCLHCFPCRVGLLDFDQNCYMA